MGIILIPLILTVCIAASLVGDRFVRHYLALGDAWKKAAVKSVLLTAPLAAAAFAALAMTIELDPIDGFMSGTEVVRFALIWSAYSSVFWAGMIVLLARERAKGDSQ